MVCWQAGRGSSPGPVAGKIKRAQRCLTTEASRMFGGKTSDEWIAQYAQSHQHPVNRFCHTIGIPLIAVSLPLFVAAFFAQGLWPVPVAMFV
ncbi:MAG: Mpo1-like protein, partial [Blastocatellia bacterium]